MDTVTIPSDAVLMRSESTQNHEYYITADALVYRRSRATGETERVLPREWNAYMYVRCGKKHHRLHQMTDSDIARRLEHYGVGSCLAQQARQLVFTTTRLYVHTLKIKKVKK